MVDRRKNPVVVPRGRAPQPGAWQSAAEQAIVWLLAVSTVVAPASFGASGIWARWTLEAVMTLVALVWSVSGLRPAVLTLLPLGVAAIGLLQVVPLPDSVLVRVAPISAGAWKIAIAGSQANPGCISVDPAATLIAVRRLLLASAIMAVVSNLGRVPIYRLILTRAVAASGIAILLAAAIFGRGREDFTMMKGLVSLRGPIHPLYSPLIMPVEGAGTGIIDPVVVGDLRYCVDSRRTGDGCGFYIYSNHFAGGVAITLPVLIAVWLGAVHGRLSPVARLLGACGLGSLGIWAVGWLASSLAGLATLLLEGVVLAALLAVNPMPKRIFAWLLITTAIAGVVVTALLLGPWQPIVIEALPESGQHAVRKMIAANGRMMATLIGLRMFRASPLLGTGLNSYELIFPRFHQDKITFFYAHSDWAQLLAEWGLAGTFIALAWVAVLLYLAWTFYLETSAPQRVVNAGAWAALAGLTFYSALDWNLHLPGNAFLCCVVGGLAISSVSSGRKPESEGNRSLMVAAQVAFALACVSAFGLLTRDARSETAKRSLNQAIVADRVATTKQAAPAPAPILMAALAAGGASAKYDPGNSKLLVVIAQALLHLAERTEDPTARSAIREQANERFTQARRASAVCRGLPERKTSTP